MNQQTDEWMERSAAAGRGAGSLEEGKWDKFRQRKRTFGWGKQHKHRHGEGKARRIGQTRRQVHSGLRSPK